MFVFLFCDKNTHTLILQGFPPHKRVSLDCSLSSLQADTQFYLYLFGAPLVITTVTTVFPPGSTQGMILCFTSKVCVCIWLMSLWSHHVSFFLFFKLSQEEYSFACDGLNSISHTILSFTCSHTRSLKTNPAVLAYIETSAVLNLSWFSSIR